MSVQWSLVIFTLLTGMAGWMLVCVAVSECRKEALQANSIAAITAIVLAIIGGLASVTHLAHPEHMLGVLSHPTEGIFLEALLTGMVILFAALYLVALRRGAEMSMRRILAILAALFGALLSFAAGKSYMMEAIPTWNTCFLPLGYLGTAIPAGIASYILVLTRKDKSFDQLSTIAFFGRLLLVGGVISAATSACYLIVAAQGQIFLSLCIVVLAGIVPAICGWLIVKQPKRAFGFAFVALISALAGGLAYRACMWLVYDKAINLFKLGL
ncbi:DmsC/YnfH family molybdoenzyme membrane anchor subunit [Cryptobacterium curtum]|uniref:dimethyl sulfoxide reductase anchor subunit family protein n=1 Tax=Cryptobacterium curtum TaxID=84163 RepID=UPI0028D1F734|nr:DmsC/YnfH family molybdoenzyme membrane anchor subunit [Cryptobacterium curtum]